VPAEPLTAEVAQAFGRRLYAARRRLGISQQELADRVDMSRETISRLERGLANESRKSSADPTLTALLALSRALGMQLRLDMALNGDVVIEFVEPWGS
jgi:transcriptional regulator with XRE-family HTH domain